MKKAENDKTNKINKIKGVLILILIVFLMLLTFVVFLNKKGNVGKGPFFNVLKDNNAQKGKTQVEQSKDKDKIEGKLDEGMMNISMNLSPIFESGESEGNLSIINEEINRHPQVVEIYIKETNDLIYRSGSIPVGYRIEHAKLLTPLKKGKYDCIAYFNAIDSETQELRGKAGAEVVITVNN